jgi:type I restriction enzyme S subunit
MTFDPKKYLEKRILIPPSLAEQDRIISTLDTMGREIHLMERQYECFQDRKRGLMQKLLSGDIEMPQGHGTLDRGPDNDSTDRHDDS